MCPSPRLVPAHVPPAGKPPTSAKLTPIKRHTLLLDPHGIETHIPPASNPQMSALTKSTPANVSQTHTHQAPYSAIRPTRDRSKRAARSQAVTANVSQTHTRQAPYSAIRPTRDRSKRAARSQAVTANTNQIHTRTILHYSTHAEKKQAECRLRARRRTLCTPSARKRCYAPIIFRVGGAERLRVVLCAAYLPRGGSLEPKYQLLISSDVITPSRRSCIRSSNSAARSATMLSSKAKSIK